jgi:parallel beta-helix repeat protein
MKKRLTILLILIATVCSSLILTNIKLLPVARATYVEGPVTQDTVWTLLESPFVLANNVTVYPNVTLTIEPGVEVRFGGSFSIIVSGKLYADGTQNTINFTSNKITPAVGDWGAIEFNGTAKSTLIGCFISYATNGILVDNANVEIENSTVSLCQNGIGIANGTGIIQNSMIAENQESGITITGAGQVTLENNTIMANGNGILLTGKDASNISVRWNKISANKNSGIEINAVDHTGIIITNNNVSSNAEGFYISSPASTYLTNNSISYNNVGVLYANGINIAIYNDIYNNEIGMDVQLNATVDAEHNYWGDPSGPYNPSLNPYGKGNPVGGNGTNLVFIFWLIKSVESVNQRPIANLLTDEVTVQPNESVMFFGTNSYDPDGRVDEYFFDFGDGTNSSWTTLSIVTHAYLRNGTYNASLTVMDDYGATSIPVTTTIYVQNLPILNVNLILNDSEVQEGSQVSLTAKVTYGNSSVGMENATVSMFSVTGGQITPISGYTNASGYFVSTYTALNVTELTNVRIVATASKIGYADNSDYEYLRILPYLIVQVSANPNTIKSQGTATIIVYVTSYSYGNPIANVSITVASKVGNLTPQSGMTDSNGIFAPVFTAPQTTTSLNATITASATKSNYILSTGQVQLLIEPKIPVVQITTYSSTTFSETKLAVTVSVEYDTLPLSGSNVTITANNGNLSTTTGFTGTYGNVTFNFTAPLVNEETNITITAQATKMGYAEAQNELKIAVEPRTFNVQIIAPQIISGEPNGISVLVRCKQDNTTVAGATVIISSTAGNFSQTTETTDQSGVSAFTFNAPITKSQLFIPITVSVTKNGYTNGANETTIKVVPKIISQTSGGWPLTTILLILIPILAVIVAVLLIEFKIVSISFEEDKKKA